MASARLLFNKPREKKIGSIVINAFTSENHVMSSTATKYPVEDGADVTDHIVPNPDTFSGTGIVSRNEADSSIIEDSYAELLRIQDERELVTIVTGLRVYTNMHISSVSIPRNAQNGGSLIINIAAAVVRKVESQTVNITATRINPDDKNQVQSTSDTGKSTSDEGFLGGLLAEAEAFTDRIGVVAAGGI